MKILHYINNLGSGGAEKLLTDILPLMKEYGNEVELLISNNKKSVEKFHEILESNEIKCINFNNSFYNPIQIIKIVRLVNKNNYDIIHAHLFPTQYWLAFASFFFKRKVKLVKTEHSVYNERKKFKFLKKLEKLIYSRYSVVIAITLKVRENLAYWLDDNNRIEVINNGVNLDQIFSVQNSNSVFDYGFLKSNNFNILMVGRFDTFNQKDQTSLVVALSLLSDDCKLFFAGEGGNQETVKQKVRDLNLEDRVVFLGMRTDVYKLMGLVNLNVLSTNHEGLSGVALESLASGIPFIGSDVVGVNDIVPDPKFLFPPKNPEILADKIFEVKNNPDLQKELVNEALTFIKEFDIKKMASKYLLLYDAVLK